MKKLAISIMYIALENNNSRVLHLVNSAMSNDLIIQRAPNTYEIYVELRRSHQQHASHPLLSF
jgi:hypothetical protein